MTKNTGLGEFEPAESVETAKRGTDWHLSPELTERGLGSLGVVQDGPKGRGGGRDEPQGFVT